MYHPKYSQEPDIPAALGILAHLSAEELRDLLNNDAKFDDIVKDVKQLKDLDTEKEMIIASNRSLAEFNLSREPDFKIKKQHLQELSETGASLCLEFKEKVAGLKEKSGDLTPETLKALLETAAGESEEESEALATKFLDGDLDIDNFLEKFLLIRKTMHLRRVKVDKLSEIRQSKKNLPPRSTYKANDTPQPILPYPLGEPNMPGGNYGYGSMY